MRAENSPTGKRIVVVDDNRDICDFMQAALAAAGYEVQTVGEGGRALALQRERAADVLITDIFMPGLEGFETITQCKAQFPQTRIVVMSAGTIPGMKHDFLEGAKLLGVAAALRKPFTADKLLDTVRQVLQV